MVNVRSKKERITQTLLALSTLICSFQFPLKVQAQTSNIIDKYISDHVATVNQQLPMMINQNVRWDSSSFLPGEAVVYEYTLTQRVSDEVPDSFSRAMYLIAQEMMCEEPELQIIYKNNISFQVYFYSKDDYLVGEFKINPADCGY